MRLIMIGTGPFAVPTFQQLFEARHDVALLVTQPLRNHRGKEVEPASAMRGIAHQHATPIYDPEKINTPEAQQYLAGAGADLLVVCDYGQILAPRTLATARLGGINLHGSLLPKYRGAGPIQWAIVDGEARTGVTIMRIDAGLDTGDMLLKAETEIGPEENAVELGRRLALMGADLLVEALESVAAGRIVPERQDGFQATYAPLLKKEDGRIDWSQPAAAIHNRIRGLQPWPGANTFWRGHALHIWRARPAAIFGGLPAGAIASVRPLIVACGTDALELLELQLEGRKRLTGAEFANGQRLRENELFGAANENE